ncbi:leucine-rich repeat domain-containing protein [Seonamhaeicola sp. NFXS20]|uniref:leucine-rich repeat domain-containing protein n=1 Tax=Seonamhaeicola sp. NFXS20 TaxID=2816959 RepID=UPI003B8BBEA6
MKKTLQLLVALLVTATMNAQAVGLEFAEGDFNFRVTVSVADGGATNEVELISWANAPTSDVAVVVPETATPTGAFFPFTVTSIGDGAFSASGTKGAGRNPANVYVTSVTLPASVTTFNGAHHFRDNPNLSSINLDNIVVLGSNTFVGCTGLTGEINLPACKDLGAYPFFNCSNITAINAPVAESAGAGVFYGMDGVREYNVPATLTTIGNLFLGDDDPTNSLEQVQLNWDATQLAAVNFANDSKFFRNEWANHPTNPNEPGSAGDTSGFAGNYAGMGVPELTGIFEGTPVKIYVPVGTKSAYEAHLSWCRFPSASIIEGEMPELLSTKEVALELGFNMYPNPTRDVVVIKNKQLRNAAVTVYDLNGRALLNKTISAAESQINISNLSNGIYLFKVKADNGEFTQRIVKQ